MKQISKAGAYTVQEIAAMVAVSESTVRLWIAKKQLRALILDGSNKQPIFRVLKEDWDKYKAARFNTES